MYNLSPRFKKIKSCGTPDNIAPNSYIICNVKGCRKNLYAPFLSSAERKFILAKTVYCHTIYNPEELQIPKVKGGSSLHNRAERKTVIQKDTPGPADYDSKILEKGCKYKPPKEHGKGRLYVCRVPYTLKGSGPSVPTHIDANGYDIDEEGNLIKNPPYNYDTTIGPAFYEILREDPCFTTRRYKGCGWSKSKSKRITMRPSTTPGPGYYHPNDNPCMKNEMCENFKEMARYFSFAPRYTESEMLRVAREDLPAPGQYETNTSSFRYTKSTCIKPVPFIFGTKRFKAAIQSDVPAPGDYQVDETLTKKRQFSVKSVPFGFQSSRFSTKQPENLPGPASYDVKGPIQEKLDRKHNKYSAVDVPFSQTAERKIGFVAEDAPCLPGPSDYDIDGEEEDADDEKQPVTACVFKSTTARFPCRSKSEDAEPASYNITESFKRNHCRMSPNTGKVPFLSTRPRSSAVRRSAPGPADYLGQDGLATDGRGLRFSNVPRFKDICDDTPGPGYYTIHPSRNVSVYRAIATHNLRLKENVLKTKLRLPPGVTWNNWISGLTKDKKLKCFLNLQSD